MARDQAFRWKIINDRIAYGNWRPNAKYSIIGALPSVYGNAKSYFSKAEALLAARALPPVAKKVRWDGVAEKYEYDDQELRRNVIMVAAGLMSADLALGEALRDDPQLSKKLKLNTSTASLESRFEPFDLIQSEVANGLFGYGYESRELTGISPVLLQKLAHRALHRLFGSDAELDPKGATLESHAITRVNKDEKLILFCAGEPTSSLVAVTQYKMFEVLSEEKVQSCDGKTIKLKGRAVKGETLPLPPAYDIDNFRGEGPIDVVSTFALTSEIDARALAGINSYMWYLGYQKVSQQEVASTKEAFEKAFVGAEVVIPVTHLLDINEFLIGTESSQQVVYERKIKNQAGKTVPIRITALFPNQSKGGYVIYDRNNLGRLISERRKVSKHSPFILNTSCYSENTVLTWMKAFRESTAIDLKSGAATALADFRDTPHIIASKTGFPTDSLADILGNFRYPVLAIESLAKGKTPRQVYDELKQPLAHNTVTSTMKWLEALLKSRSSGDSDANRSFEPVYNLDVPNIFEADGYEVMADVDGKTSVY